MEEASLKPAISNTTSNSRSRSSSSTSTTTTAEGNNGLDTYPSSISKSDKNDPLRPTLVCEKRPINGDRRLAPLLCSSRCEMCHSYAVATADGIVDGIIG